jgi:hypothetical protein
MAFNDKTYNVASLRYTDVFRRQSAHKLDAAKRSSHRTRRTGKHHLLVGMGYILGWGNKKQKKSQLRILKKERKKKEEEETNRILANMCFIRAPINSFRSSIGHTKKARCRDARGDSISEPMRSHTHCNKKGIMINQQQVTPDSLLNAPGFLFASSSPASKLP